MSHHDLPESAHYNEEEAEGNSQADVLAMFSFVVILVVIGVFFAGS